LRLKDGKDGFLPGHRGGAFNFKRICSLK